MLLNRFLPLPKELVSGAVTDAADQAGVDYFLLEGMKMLNPGNRMFGPIRTVLIEEVEGQDENLASGLSFLDSLGPGEILFVAGSSRFAYFGEMMTRLSQSKNLGGAAIYGASRDSSFTSKSSFPLASIGCTPVDIKSRGRVSAFDVSLSQITEGAIEPGDVLFGDSDGVVLLKRYGLSNFFVELEKVLENEKSLDQSLNQGVDLNTILSRHVSF